MLKTQHPIDYLKKEGEVTNLLEEQQNTQQSSDSFKPKSRVRRQYNPEDNNRKLFNLISEHKKGSPLVDKVNDIKGLLDKVDINYTDSDGDTFLHAAIHEGHQDVVKLLLERGADKTIKNANNKTPLDLARDSGNQEIIDILTPKKANLLQAAKEGNIEQVKLLVEEGADLNIRDNDGNRPLHLAAKEEKLEVVKYLMEKGAQFNARNDDSKTPLQLAEQYNHGEIKNILTATQELFTTIKDDTLNEDQKIERLENGIGEGAIINAENYDHSDTPLHLAAEKGYLKIVEYFINTKKEGISINIKNHAGRTPLFYAIGSGNLDAIKYLVEKRADFTTPDKYSFTPLYFAVLTSDISDEVVLDIVKYLEGKGADLKIIPKDTGLTLLHTAAYNGHLKVVQYLIEEKDFRVDITSNSNNTPLHEAAHGEKLKVVKYLIENKADVNTKNKDDMTPLSYYLNWAAYKGAKLEVAQYLIDNGADISIKDKDGKTPLYNAVQQGKEEIVKFLAEEADEKTIDIKDANDRTPLLQAVEKGNFLIVEHLVKNNANVNAKDKNEKTPLDIATESSRSDIIELLRNTREGISFDVKRPINSFVGRKEELRNLHKAILRKSDQETSHITSITGLGGVGKSEVAKRYIQRFGKYYDGNVIWINAETDETLKVSFHKLAKEKLKINIKDIDEEERSLGSIVEDVYKYFADKKSLFIFDNVEKDDIGEFLPKSEHKPYILLTSRNRELFSEQKIDLKVFSESEYKLFIKQALGENALQDRDVEKLGKTLGYLPLALQHTVAYIKKSNFEISDYVKIYEKSEEEVKSLLDQSGLSYDKTIFATFKITVAKIEQSTNEESELSREILDIMAYLAPDNIPKKTFLELALNSIQENNPEIKNIRAQGKLNRAVNLLDQYSAINLGQDQLNIHRLTQQVIVFDLKSKNAEEKTLEKTLGLLKKQMVSHDSIESYTPHIISAWSYAKQYDKLVEDFIVNDVINDVKNRSTRYFHLIAGSSNDEIVNTILSKIKDPNKLRKVINTRDENKKTPLHYAAQGGNEEIVRLLISKKANVDTRDRIDNRPLHIAAKNGHLGIVNVLLDNKANVNDETSPQYKFTPLHLAAQNGHLAVVNVLLGKRAEINSKTKHEFTPLHLAAQGGYLEVVNSLLDKGAEIEVETEYKNTALHLAAKNGHLGIIEALLEKGANVNAQDKDGFISLHWAAFLNDHVNVVNKLLENGEININAKTIKGNTPLHLAAGKGHLKVIEALIAKSADIDARNNENKTPLELAKDQETINIFERHRQSSLVDNAYLEASQAGNQEISSSKIESFNAELFTRINVPADGSCLFWAAALAYFTPVKYDDNAFQERFERLFGNTQSQELTQVQNLIKAYDPSSNSAAIRNDETLRRLVTEKFRNRVIDEISSHQSKFEESITIHDFLYSKNEDYVVGGTFQGRFRSEFSTEISEYNIDISKLKPATLNEATVQEIDSELDKIPDQNKVKKFKFETYVEYMRDSRAWGGNHEIQAMSQVLHSNILVFSDGTKHSINYDNTNDQIQLFNNGESHYNFGLVKAQKLIEAISSNEQQKARTYLNLGIDNVNYKDSEGWTVLHFAAQYDNKEIVQLLLNQEADVNIKNRLKQTPLDVARLFERNDVVDRLTQVRSSVQQASIEQDLVVDPQLKFSSRNQAESSNQIEQRSTNRRKGTSGISGQLYEIELSMLFLLQGVKQKKDGKIEGFYLDTNMAEAGDFDDVVFKYKYNENEVEKSKIIFLQAKHRENPEKGKITVDKLLSKLDKGDFLLKKYFTSYRKIKQQFSEEGIDPIFGSKFEDSNFIIYTNALSTFSNTDSSIKEADINESDFLRTLDLQSKYYQLEFNSGRKEEILSVLENASDCRRLAKELVTAISSGKGIDMQKDIFKSYHIALAEKVIDKTSIKEGKLNNNFLDDNENLSSEDKEFRRIFFEETGKVFNKQGDELKQELQGKVIKFSDKFGVKDGDSNLLLPSDLVTENEVEEFLSKLKLFFGQPSESQLSQILRQKIQSVYKVEQNDIDATFADVKSKVERWWKDGNDYLTEDNKFFQESAKVSIWFDVKDPVPLFTGRTEKLQELHRALQNGGQLVISQMASVTGLGGIGKSELARKYISEHSKDYDDNVVWINADNYLTIAESLRRLAKDKLGISTTDENGKEKEIKLIVKDVYSFFVKRHRKSLFVFDNAGKYKAVKEGDEGIDKFLPSGPNKPSVLITSRDQEWGTSIAQLQLGVFTKEEAVEFIRKALKIEAGLQESEIKNLAKELQYLPLALQQAVSYIKKEDDESKKLGKEGFTIGSYLDKFNEKKSASELLGKASGETHDRYTETVLTTWQITTDKIKQKRTRGGTQALEMLEVMAYLAPDKIPMEEIFSKLISDEDARNEAALLLDQYSMANLDGGKLNIHRLVQQITRLKLEDKEEETLRKALELINDSYVAISHVTSVWDYSSKYGKLIDNFYFSSVYGESKSTPLHLFADSGNYEATKAILKHIKYDGYFNKVRKLFSYVYDIDSKDTYGRTPLYRAAENGHMKVVELLIDSGASIHVNSAAASSWMASGWTVLHGAVYGGNKDVVKFLVDKGANVNAKDSIGRDPLYIAINEGHEEIAKLLDKTGENVLSIVASLGKIGVIKKILENKSEEERIRITNPAKEGKRGPLHLAANNGHLKVVELLIENGADINSSAYDGFTPLHLAASEGYLDIVKFLVKKSNDKFSILEVSDISGWTVLHSAAKSGHTKVLEYLINKFSENKEELALINAADKKGTTLLETAAFHGMLDTVQFLINKKANINTVNIFGVTPLFASAIQNNYEVVKYLLEQKEIKIDCDEKKVLGMLHITPLHAAAVYDNLDMVKLLVERGLSVNVGEKDSLTPLHGAAFFNSAKVIKYLVDNRASTNAVINFSNIANVLNFIKADFKGGYAEQFIGYIIKFCNVCNFIGARFTPVTISTAFEYNNKLVLRDINAKPIHSIGSRSISLLLSIPPIAKQLRIMKDYVQKKRDGEQGIPGGEDSIFFDITNYRAHVQYYKVQQKAFLYLDKYISNHLSDAKVKAVKQGLYLPSFESRNVKIDGKCAGITRMVSQGLFFGGIEDYGRAHKLFLNNLKISVELYERLAQGKQISEREEKEIFALSRLLDNAEQELTSPTSSLPSTLSHIKSYKTLDDLSHYVSGLTEDFAIHLVTSNHVVAIYRTGDTYTYFDSNVALVSDLKSVDQLMKVVKKGVAYAGYALAEEGFLVEHFDVTEANNALTTEQKEILERPIQTERHLLSLQDQEHGLIDVDGEKISRVTLYDMGAKLYSDGSASVLINSEMSSEDLAENLNSGKIKITAREYLQSLKGNKKEIIQGLVQKTSTLSFDGSIGEIKDAKTVKDLVLSEDGQMLDSYQLNKILKGPIEQSIKALPYYLEVANTKHWPNRLTNAAGRISMAKGLYDIAHCKLLNR